MRRVRNLTLFAIAVLVILGAAAWIFRDRLGLLFGVNVDAGGGGEAALVLPEGFSASVFASGLDNPRFLEVGPDGTLFVAERGADRVVALPDAGVDGRADEIVEVGTGYGRGQDLEFTDDGTLLVAGQSTLWEVTLDGLREAERRAVVDDLPTGGSHSTTPRHSPWSAGRTTSSWPSTGPGTRR